ncbi:MAG: general secretion pathway protein GspK [Acidobacteriota bacterium]
MKNREMEQRATKKREKGVILVMILWVLLAISMLALSFSAAIRTEVDAARNVVDQKQSYYMARAGIEYAIYKIFQANSAFGQLEQMRQEGIEGIPEVLTGSVSLSLAHATADVEIIDESGKLNLNLAPDHLIWNLLIMVGIEPALADIIEHSILDWRDQDDFYRENGAENDYYQSLPEPYLAKNGPFDVPEELLLVQGVTPEIYYGRKGLNEAGQRVEYYGLQNYFTTFSSINRINVNSAPIPVLASVPTLDYEIALQIDALRQQAPIMEVGELTHMIPGISTEALAYLSQMRSNVYTLVSDGHLNNSEVISRIRTVIRLTGGGRHAVLYWNESNIEM